MNHKRPNNEELIDVLFEDMKKMDSVNKRLQREINDLRIELENVPGDMRMMDSHIKKLVREVSELKNQSRGISNKNHSESQSTEHR
jgi:polyhydroxyalkanoate synthesis regulator phasin